MPTASTVRRITPPKQRNFGKIYDVHPVPDLTEIQTRSYERFLQADLPAEERDDAGLEGVFREIFPIESYDKTLKLEYIKFDLGKPRYEPDECRQLRLTYGRPLHVWLRLNKGETALEESVYLGDMPIMIGGGEFIINGAERVVVSQLHRSPGVDFVVDIEAGDKKLHACRVIPERGSWIELQVSKKDTLRRPDRPVGQVLGDDPAAGHEPDVLVSDDAILQAFYDSEDIDTSKDGSAALLEGRIACGDVVDPNTGEVLIESGATISKVSANVLADAKIGVITVLKDAKDLLILQSLQEDPTTDHESALLRIYQRLRPGNPPQLEKARELFHEKFFDTNRYRLGKVGRFRINRKFNQTIPDDQMILDPLDYVNAIRYILNLRKGKGHVDDIDHLGNRRLRTIDELAADELRKGFLKLRRTVQERMSLKEAEDITPRQPDQPQEHQRGDRVLLRPRRAVAGRRPDQPPGPAHPRAPALGARAGRFEPEAGGLRGPRRPHLALRPDLPDRDPRRDEHRPDQLAGDLRRGRRVRLPRHPLPRDQGRAPDREGRLDAGRRGERGVPGPRRRAGGRGWQAQGAAGHRPVSDRLPHHPHRAGPVSGHLAQADGRRLGRPDPVPRARRRQPGARWARTCSARRCPLLVAEPPIVATGLERAVAMNSGMIVKAPHDATVTYVDATRIILDHNIIFKLRKYVGLNERTCLNQKPVVSPGQKVKKGEILADGAATYHGELALGRNVLVGFMAWDGYNFEDAIILSERIVKEDVYTSIHIEEFEIEIRETKLGREEFTRDIPNVSEKALRNLDENGIVRIGTYVKPGDILVGKVAPKSKSELTPEEKLLHAIFGRAGEDVKNDSLEVPSGVEGIVINTQRFSRRMSLNEDERKAFEKELKDTEAAESVKIADEYKQMIKALEEVSRRPGHRPRLGQAVRPRQGPQEPGRRVRAVQA